MSDRSFARGGFTVIAAVAMVGCLMVVGCGDDRQPIFSTAADHQSDDEAKQVQIEIATLAKGKNPNDPDASAAYENAKDKLIQRGAGIENQLIEGLVGSDDWGVRLGCIEVLKAVGGRRCIEPIIGALEDSQPLVALNADYLLVGLCKHREIPVPGQPPGANGLPPVPARDPKDLALNAEEKLWAAWHREHHAALRKAWSDWWAANKDKVKVD